MFSKLTRFKLASKNRTEAEKKTAEMLMKWQTKWTWTTKAVWTRLLISSLIPWVTRDHGEINNYMSQAFSGHGCFGSYRKKIGKTKNYICAQCEYSPDTPVM